MMKETTTKLNELKRRDEIVLRCALAHLWDVGARHLTPEAIERTCSDLMMQDDTQSFMTNEFQCAIVRTAGEIAGLPQAEVLTWVGKNVKYWVQ